MCGSAGGASFNWRTLEPVIHGKGHQHRIFLDRDPLLLQGFCPGSLVL